MKMPILEPHGHLRPTSFSMYLFSPCLFLICFIFIEYSLPGF